VQRLEVDGELLHDALKELESDAGMTKATVGEERESSMQQVADQTVQYGFRMLSKTLAAWLQGTMRGCFFVFGLNHAKNMHESQAQASALGLISQILSVWMAGTLRGCILNMRRV